MNTLFDNAEKDLIKTCEFPINTYCEGNKPLRIRLFNDDAKSDVEVESIWIDIPNEIMLHCCHEEFEGDIKLRSLSDENRLVVLKYIQTLNMGKED